MLIMKETVDVVNECFQYLVSSDQLTRTGQGRFLMLNTHLTGLGLMLNTHWTGLVSDVKHALDRARSEVKHTLDRAGV